MATAKVADKKFVACRCAKGRRCTINKLWDRVVITYMENYEVEETGVDEEKLLKAYITAWETFRHVVGGKTARAIYWRFQKTLTRGHPMQSDCDPDGGI